MFFSNHWPTFFKSKSSMKKSAFLFIVFLITINTVHSQENKSSVTSPLYLSFGTNFGLPVGEKSSSAIKYAFGADLQLVYRAASKIDLTGSAGFDLWHHDKGVNWNYVPLLGGVRYALSNKVFLSEQAGYSVLVSDDTETDGFTKGAFTDIAGIGIKTGQNSDLLLAYKGLFYSEGTLSTVNLRISYRFGK
jgi:hypothetical protein